MVVVRGLIAFVALLTWLLPLVTRVEAETAELKRRALREILVQVALGLIALIWFFYAGGGFEFEARDLLLALPSAFVLGAQWFSLRAFWKVTRKDRYLPRIQGRTTQVEPRPAFASQADAEPVVLPFEIEAPAYLVLLVRYLLISTAFLGVLLLGSAWCSDELPDEFVLAEWVPVLQAWLLLSLATGVIMSILYRGRWRRACLEHREVRFQGRMWGDESRCAYAEILFVDSWRIRGGHRMRVGFENASGFHVAYLATPPFEEAELLRFERELRSRQSPP